MASLLRMGNVSKIEQCQNLCCDGQHTSRIRRNCFELQAILFRRAVENFVCAAIRIEETAYDFSLKPREERVTISAPHDPTLCSRSSFLPAVTSLRCKTGIFYGGSVCEAVPVKAQAKK